MKKIERRFLYLQMRTDEVLRHFTAGLCFMTDDPYAD